MVQDKKDLPDIRIAEGGPSVAALVADQKPKHDENSGVQQNTLKVEWTSDEEAGTHDVSMTGRLRFTITEAVNDGGEIVMKSGLFRNDQEELKDAISVALKNAVNRAFVTRWKELFPPEVTERKAREKSSEKVARLEQRADTMEQIVNEMSAAMIEDRPINFDLFDQLGVDPAKFGLQRPKDS